MSRLDALPPDQQAALALLLRQGKTYGEVAELLGIRQIAIHDRAHAALAVLAPQQARMLTAPRREEVGNYLLGQEADATRRKATRDYLATSEEGRAWASAVATELASLSDRPLAAVPDEGSTLELPEAERGDAAATKDPGEAPPAGEPEHAEPPQLKDTAPDRAGEPTRERPGAAREPRRDRPPPRRGPARDRPAPRRDAERERPVRTPGPRPATTELEGPTGRSGSRRGGAVLLGLIVVAVVVAVVLLTRGGSHKESTGTSASVSSTSRSSSSSSSTSSSSSETSTTTTATTGSKSISGPKTEARFNLTAHAAGSHASAVVEILSEDGKHAFYISAKNLPPSKGFFYAVWLYNSPTDSKGLGRAPAVGSSGRLEGGLLLPSDASDYHEMLLTEETSTTPTQPGTIVLSGPFALH